MLWIPLGAWIGALLVAVVLLGFCAYEIVWKSARLRRDVAALQAVNADAQALQARLAQVSQRIAAVGRR